MEFRFNVNSLFNSNVVKVTPHLTPNGFNGDRRQLIDMTSKMTEIINAMGEASARAQGLNKAVTTAQKLRNSDQVVYLLTDNSGPNGAVTGLLKVGTKNLYVFDANGETQQVPAPCVLDFYVHESRQRAGHGKALFEAMLSQERYDPHKLAIDRPSEKLIGFLRKHYGLSRTIPQMNNFVVYEGFFGAPANGHSQADQRNVHITASPNTALFGPHVISETKQAARSPSTMSCVQPPVVHNTPIGRFGAPRPVGSMAEIIHSSPTAVSGEPNSQHGFDSDIDHMHHRRHHHHHHHHYIGDEEHHVHHSDVHIDAHPNRHFNHLNNNITNTVTDDVDEIDEKLSEIIETVKHIEIGRIDAAPPPPMQVSLKGVKFIEPEPMALANQVQVDAPPVVPQPAARMVQPPTHFHLSKQHTGMKNRSFNVGAAVSPTGKMEFVQERPESFGLLKINRPIGGLGAINNFNNTNGHHHAAKVSPIFDQNHHAAIYAATPSPIVTGEGMTDQGYFDLKFYHNKLW